MTANSSDRTPTSTHPPTPSRIIGLRRARAAAAEPTEAGRAAAAATAAAETADRLRGYCTRVRLARPDHGDHAVLGVRVADLETLLADHARLTATHP